MFQFTHQIGSPGSASEPAQGWAPSKDVRSRHRRHSARPLGHKRRLPVVRQFAASVRERPSAQLPLRPSIRRSGCRIVNDELIEFWVMGAAIELGASAASYGDYAHRSSGWVRPRSPVSLSRWLRENGHRPCWLPLICSDQTRCSSCRWWASRPGLMCGRPNG